jgi:hypothetical protein
MNGLFDFNLFKINNLWIVLKNTIIIKNSYYVRR